MEEVWKDINLSSLYHYSISTPREDLPNTPSITLPPQQRFNNNNFGNTAMSLQDFLARPLTIMDPTSTDHHIYCGSTLAPPPPPVTVLSLNSGGEFRFLDNSGTPKQNGNCNSVIYPSSASGLASFGKNKISELDSGQGDGRDRRHRRMIKNRESAARSRARKQAYTNELELEVAHLQEENERLRRQQVELRRVEATQQPKKFKLFRTSTAPF